MTVDGVYILRVSSRSFLTIWKARQFKHVGLTQSFLKLLSLCCLTDSLEKTDAGRDWGQEEKGTTEDEMAGWHHQLDGHVWANSGSWWWTGRPGVLQFMGSQRVGHEWATELNWTVLSHSEQLRFFMHPLRGTSLFGSPLILPYASPTGLQRQMVWRLVFPV